MKKPKPKTKRVAVTVNISIPAEMTIGETDKWVERCFPRSAHAICMERFPQGVDVKSLPARFLLLTRAGDMPK